MLTSMATLSTPTCVRAGARFGPELDMEVKLANVVPVSNKKIFLERG